MIRRLLPAVTAALVLLAPAAVIHAAPAVEGEACAPGVGTTILVDLTPAQEALTVSCVEGVQDSVSAALSAAGLNPGPTTGMLESLAGVRADSLPDTFWAMYVSTTDGMVAGEPSDEWIFANEGIDAGPVPVDTALSFHLQDWNDNPGRMPVVSLVDLRPGGEPSSSGAEPTTPPTSGSDPSTSVPGVEPTGDVPTPAEESSEDSGTSTVVWVVVGVVLVLAAVGVVLAARRRRAG